MDYISEIRTLANEGLCIDPDFKIFGANYHKWQFGEKVDMQQIRDYERDMKIILPQPLIRYLTELGDGGAGPDYGIYNLDKIKKLNAFLPKTRNLPVMLDHSMTSEQWVLFAHKYEELNNKIDYNQFNSKREEQRVIQEIENMNLSLLAGGIFINTPGCTMNSLLMYRGAARGEVFNIDFDYICELQSEPYCYGKFEEWIINSMKQSLKR